ncbi:iron complex outermembrane receptor protein [Duganella sp. SG902]|uniref:TonB-dependent receptor plug domain-containing protein n=1 Tax=Duganella sp. SG902 TaxID=2587016 RepID=UPI00159DE05C|nr:TonB-dependent receptor [Duganella sp. SG902]NVM76014.1 iron complex outermembrane receptor protein [Duganella sp. SG902]
MQIKFKLNPLAAGAIALLCGAAGPTTALAQDSVAATTPPAVVITGSRIPRAGTEGPSAVTVLTGEDITKQGYRNVFDALTNQTQNSGFVQGADYGNTFTPSANAISLRGLGPNHTLVLLNGRRMADFPIAYEGTVNFTNLANIPSSVVDRIEILSGGASAVYGSDAIAGVVNIILKKQADGVDINLKAGGASRGGAGDQRLQLTGGKSFGKLNTLFSAELLERDPLWSADRDFMAAKTGVAPTSVLGRKNVSTGKYVDLGDTCSSLGDLFGGSTVKYTAKAGSYCASPKVGPTYWTTQTRNSSQNLFGSANYELSPETTLYAEALFGQNRSTQNTRGPSWTSRSLTDSYFWNQNTNAYEAWNRYISPEEIGGVDRYNRYWDDQASSLSFGARGVIPGTSWNYEAGYTASLYKSQDNRPRALANIDSFFLGPHLGVDKNGVAIYAPDPARLTRRLTPREFDSITGNSVSDDKSWTNTLSLTANGDAFALPAGPVKVAAVAELGKQGFSNAPDARINQGYFNAATGADVTAGTRKRYALGVETNIPVIKTVNATLAGRYDKYSFAGRDDGKFTYNGGVEWRPVQQLLVRGNYATSFRAPDMNYIFKARGTGYYSSTTDYYRCAKAGQPVADCEFANYAPGADYVQTGSKDLRPEKGRSSGLGIVWSPSADFDVTVDYWNIKISDLVTNLSADNLLRDEADCRIRGDLTSPTCADAIARITRYPENALNKPGEIKSILVNPINAATTSVDGVDISGKYVFRTKEYGNFITKANYSKTLNKHSRQFTGDPLNDDLEDLTNYDWRDKLNASVTWNVGKWSNTVFFQRYGKVPNAAGDAWLTPTTLVNASVVYRLNERATVSMAVNNLFNQVKVDSSAGWPYYPVGNYSPVGRQAWVELNYHFGG